MGLPEASTPRVWSGVLLSVGTLPARLRVGLPTLAQAGDGRSDEAALLDALGRADADELFGEPVHGHYWLGPEPLRQFAQKDGLPQIANNAERDVATNRSAERTAPLWQQTRGGCN